MIGDFLLFLDTSIVVIKSAKLEIQIYIKRHPNKSKEKLYYSYVHNATLSDQKFPVRHSILPPNPKRRQFALFSVLIILLCSVVLQQLVFFLILSEHRRRIHTENMAKVVTAVWVFAPGQFEEQDEFILFLVSSWCTSPSFSYHPGAKLLARQVI